MAKWNIERLPDTYQLTEGSAYVRIQGQTYRVAIDEFKLVAKPGETIVKLYGILEDK
jgi:hypothetical protein